PNSPNGAGEVNPVDRTRLFGDRHNGCGYIAMPMIRPWRYTTARNYGRWYAHRNYSVYKDWVAVMMFPSSSSAGPRGARICASYAEVRDDRPAVPVRPNAEADGTARTGRRVAVGNRMSRPVRTPAPGGMDRFVRPVRSGRFDVDDKSPPQKRPSPLPLSENHLGGAVLDTAEPRRTSRVGVPQGTHPAGTPAEYRGSPVDSAA